MPAPNNQKIGLGTVQWGRSYGVANRSGQPPQKEVSEILARATAAHVDVLDTAWDYGQAEKLLGIFNACTSFRVLTKTIQVPDEVITVANKRDVERSFQQSLHRLNTDCVGGVMIHYCDDLLRPGGHRLWHTVNEFKAQGRAQSIGVSVYHPEQLLKLIDRYSFDVVQLPYSIYDQRFAAEGLLQSLKKAGIEVHTRSAFLQGALLMVPDSLPPHLHRLRDHQSRWWSMAATRGLTPLQAALGFAIAQPAVDHVIVGCETLAQAEEIFQASAVPGEIDWLNEFAIDDISFLDPSRWPA
jgi:aryl-alcohol dehydrogenase-like predicted oxidoreductase